MIPLRHQKKNFDSCGYNDFFFYELVRSCWSGTNGWRTQKLSRRRYKIRNNHIYPEGSYFFFFFLVFFFIILFSPTAETGGVWPPIYFKTINPNNIPLVNTGILLSSGVLITWAHRDLLGNKGGLTPLILTFTLGIYFLFIQIIEYLISPLTIRDGVYGSIFFIATGFHGLHVIIGTIFLIVIYYRFLKGRFSRWTHLRCEMAIWYWHFVDVVWLFLYRFVYYWGS